MNAALGYEKNCKGDLSLSFITDFKAVYNAPNESAALSELATFL